MKTCFVVMPIGNQKYNDNEITQSDLKEKYDDLIKDAIQSIDEDIVIVRADEVSDSGSISKDIFKKLISSEFVVVDITYPNPNVFYELGLRHAIRNKTILIKEKGSVNNPFDISGLRYIEYENTATGLKKLKDSIRKAFQVYEDNRNHIDNDFLYVALSFGYFFQKIKDNKSEAQKKALKQIISNKELMKAFIEEDDSKIVELLSSLDNLDELIDGIVDTGALDWLFADKFKLKVEAIWVVYCR